MHTQPNSFSKSHSRVGSAQRVRTTSRTWLVVLSSEIGVVDSAFTVTIAHFVAERLWVSLLLVSAARRMLFHSVGVFQSLFVISICAGFVDFLWSPRFLDWKRLLLGRVFDSIGWFVTAIALLFSSPLRVLSSMRLLWIRVAD